MSKDFFKGLLTDFNDIETKGITKKQTWSAMAGKSRIGEDKMTAVEKAILKAKLEKK